ncbi:MAG: PA0069 family radical SAM protein, partial [Planctomycetota bacterium]
DDWLKHHYPDRRLKVLSLMRQAHGGRLYSAKWFERRRGTGPYADQLRQNFKLFKKRAGLDQPLGPMNSDDFRPPNIDGQMRLFN